MINITSSLEIQSALLIANNIIKNFSKSITDTLFPTGEKTIFLLGLKQMLPDL